VQLAASQEGLSSMTIDHESERSGHGLLEAPRKAMNNLGALAKTESKHCPDESLQYCYLQPISFEVCAAAIV
jgi:hypothetical protein